MTIGEGSSEAFDAILFDNDGVLVDTEPLFFQASQEMLATVEVHLSVEDDGTGFDPDGEIDGDRHGLRGMAERAELIGGHLDIRRSEAGGTAVELTVEKTS